jgi:hypothetical protein
VLGKEWGEGQNCRPIRWVGAPGGEEGGGDKDARTSLQLLTSTPSKGPGRQGLPPRLMITR